MYRYRRCPQGFHGTGDAYTRRFDDITRDEVRYLRCSGTGICLRRIETPRELLEILTEKGTPCITQNQTGHVTIYHLQTSARIIPRSITSARMSMSCQKSRTMLQQENSI